MGATDVDPTQARVRRARPQDVDLVASLIRELADYEKLGHEAVATRRDLRRWLFGPRPAAEVLICRVGDDDAGFALYHPTFSTFTGRPGLFLVDLFVRPRFRGFGLGRMLLRRVARACVQRGYRRLEWNVLDWNEGAIRFYKSLGAEHMEGWRLFRLSGTALERLGRKPAKAP